MSPFFYYTFLLLVLTSSLVAGPSSIFKAADLSSNESDQKALIEWQVTARRNTHDPLNTSSLIERSSTRPQITEKETPLLTFTDSQPYADPLKMDSISSPSCLIGSSTSSAVDAISTPPSPILDSSDKAIVVVPPSSYLHEEQGRDAHLAEYPQNWNQYQANLETHHQAVNALLKKQERPIVQKMLIPFKKLQQIFRPGHLSRTQEKVATTADELAASYTNLETATTVLGYQHSSEVQNQAIYSEEQIVFNENSYPKEGNFTFGKELKHQLETVQQNYFLTLLQAPTASDATLAAAMMRDFNRATFTLNIRKDSELQPESQELIYDHAQEPVVKTALITSSKLKGEQINESVLDHDAIVTLQDRGFKKFEQFVNEERGFKLAIGSLMYQAGTADLEYIKYDLPRDQKQNLAPYFSLGFKSVRELQDASQIRAGTQPEQKILYSLEKVVSHDGATSHFQLTNFSSFKTERVDMETKKAFTLSTTDIVTYRFERNKAFDSNSPYSLENLPVIITCTGGELSHQFDQCPTPPDTISLSEWDHLTLEQQRTVTDYRAAEQAYVTAKQEWQSRYAYLASRPLFGSLISSEKLAADATLEKLRGKVQAMATPVTEDLATAAFLERNVIKTGGKTLTVQSEIDAHKSFNLPEKVSFLGGRELQQATTEQLNAVLLTWFKRSHHELSNEEKDSKLAAAAKKIAFATESILPTSPSTEDACQNLLKFTENTNVAEAITALVENPNISLTSTLLKEPLLEDTLSTSLENATAMFSLEKKSHASSTRPLFILNATYHLNLAFTEDNMSRELDAAFTYAVKENSFWDRSEPLSPKNLPVEARCIGVSIHQSVEEDE